MIYTIPDIVFAYLVFGYLIGCVLAFDDTEGSSFIVRLILSLCWPAYGTFLLIYNHVNNSNTKTR